MNTSILIVDDNTSILSALKLFLSRYFDVVATISSPKTLLSTMRENDFDVVLLDMNYKQDANTGNEGLFWLSEIKKYYSCEVVLFTAFGDIDLAVNGIKRGAYDFVIKPWDNEKLVKTLLDAAKSSQSKKKKHTTKADILSNEATPFWGESAAMQSLKSVIEKIAPNDVSVLITGENGTGKDVLAKEIHRRSNRSHKPFVAVDMGSIPESLFESELFGHVKGAFTDAYTDHIGKFESADGGTLFLDEISNIPLHLQAKLLRVLQNRNVSKVGSNKEIPIDIRLICATNASIEKMVFEKSFREDLFYRINTIRLQLPALRERHQDIVPMAEMFMQQFAQQYNRPIIRIDQKAKETLSRCQWGGNVRELQNCVEKAVILCESDTLQVHDFQLNYMNYWMPEEEEKPTNTLEEIEKNAILTAMKQCDGNLSMLAKQLNITRQTLYNKLKKYNI